MAAARRPARSRAAAALGSVRAAARPVAPCPMRLLLCLLGASVVRHGLAGAAPPVSALEGGGTSLIGKLRSSDAITGKTLVRDLSVNDTSDPEVGAQAVDCDSDSCVQRRMSVSDPFFAIPPYVSVGAVGGKQFVFDAHGPYCQQNYDRPAISDVSLPGYPQDATDELVKADMACGIAPMRFVFSTSDLPAYTDDSETAVMQVLFTLQEASFIVTQLPTCDSILAATGEFPRISKCEFTGPEAILYLSSKLRPDHLYTITIKVKMPATRMLASENTFDMSIKFEGKYVVERTQAPVDMVGVVPSAKDTSPEAGYGDNLSFQRRGYITGFMWQPDTDYKSYLGVETTFTFGLRSFGVMLGNSGYVIEIVAYPTDVWRFGTPGSVCDYTASGYTKTICEYRSFPGAPDTESNGFQIIIGTDAADNLGSAAAASFSIQVRNPMVPVNAYWTATSFRYDTNLLPFEPYTVFLDKPIAVLGAPQGTIVGWELASVSQEQWVTMELYPGNTLMPSKTGVTGIIVIIPPHTFQVISNQEPENVPGYNPLPCRSWSEADREEGRWTCTLEDEVPFAQTPYRIRFRVTNPPTPGAALSWRVELWQTGSTKPVAITRQVRGLQISGQMLAALAPFNQLVGASNVIKFDFTPSQDIGDYQDTRLEVEAPPGFVIKKTPPNFDRIFIPVCTVAGSDSNSFYLLFNATNALRAGVQYQFALEVDNPNEVVSEDLNYWSFHTVRPNGMGRDTARYKGFSMFPSLFASFKVQPEARYAGPQFVLVRFTSTEVMEIQDYIRVRAPTGVNWYVDDLGFSSSNADTGSLDLSTTTPVIGFNNKNELEFQLRASTGANLEYGFRCRVVVPDGTPIPNRWWIEQFKATGDLGSGTIWSNIASIGTDGFQTQALINVAINPFNVVQDGWDNPTMFVFEAATAIPSRVVDTVAGPITIPAELHVKAPPLFTYICPLEETLYLPPGAVHIPGNVTCEVDHDTTVDAKRLKLIFAEGLEAGNKYAFTIDVVNAPYIDPTDNSFTLETRIGDELVEDTTVDGYPLAAQMDNTRYYPSNLYEDRKALAANNVVTFILGLAAALNEPTILEIKAPVGYRFRFDCTRDVGQATWVPNMLTPPTVDTCQNRQDKSPELDYIADVHMNGYWGLGSHAIFVNVSNPQFDAERNFWGFTIRNTAIPLASEPWVYGFNIQAVTQTMFKSYVPANTINGEAAINQVDLGFMLATSLPPSTDKNGEILLTAPEGFFFPRVCLKFIPDARSTMYEPLPSTTECVGNNGRLLTLTLPSWAAMHNNTLYQFRFTVINPSYTFLETDNDKGWWRLETQYPPAAGQPAQQVDLNSVIPSFPVYQRLQYFSVDTLNQMGDTYTDLRILFQLDSNLAPQKKVTIKGPDGMQFRGMFNPFGDDYCVDPELDVQFVSMQFARPAISGVIALPEWMHCRIVDGDKIVLTNSESILQGRSLETLMVYEFFVQNVTNPPFVPDINLFSITAETDTGFEQEVWSFESWDLYPQLTDCSVESENPGYGLFTNFTFTLGTVTEVPALGSIQITGPDDYYFGPILGLVADPLVSAPPPQGLVDERPPETEKIACSLQRPSELDWVCVLEFQPCLDRAGLEEIGALLTADQQATLDAVTQSCLDWQNKCDGGDLSELIDCESQGSTLTLTLKQDVILPGSRFFQIKIPGMNSRYAPDFGNETLWSFRTRDSDVDKTVMDERGGVAGLSLMGVVTVDSIIPLDAKVSSIENYVTVTMRLATRVEPYALIRVAHPVAYTKNENAATQGASVVVAETWPTKTIDIVQSGALIEFTSFEEAIPADTDLTFTVILSNPSISPLAVDNVWTFQALSRANSDTYYLLNTHLHVQGFKVFGEFSVATIVPTVLSPTAENRIYLTFMLKSPLAYTLTSYLIVWIPKGWQPNTYVPPGCVLAVCQWWAETADPQLLSGTEASAGYDAAQEQHYVQFRLGGTADSGIEYGFSFDVLNPAFTPRDSPNEWRVETSQNGVLLHLQPSIMGFGLQELETAKVTPTDTTSLLAHNKVAFSMESNQRLSGGSLITIMAPVGFVFDCYDSLALFETRGLASTTTCSDFPLEPNRAELTMDSLDEKIPNSPFTIIISMTNPEFTPEDNWFTFSIVNPAGVFTDVANFVPAYDITGRIAVDVHGTFPYFGYDNPLVVVFMQTTIMNMQEEGNELVLTGPVGYVFPESCTGFGLRFTQDTSTQDVPGYTDSFLFPPAGIECEGQGNSTVIVRLPLGSGLLKNNYTMTVDVKDPLEGEINSSSPSEWTFITRVRNNRSGRIVDSNIDVEPTFELKVLVENVVDEGGAPPGASPNSAALLLGALVFAARLAAR